jgi:hypothetical protein
MRFNPWPRMAFNDTKRKRAFVARKQAAELEAYPLLAEMIAAEQPTVDAVMSERRSRWDAEEIAGRQRRAAKWLEGRQAMAALPPDVRAKLMRYWNGHRWLPGDPSYFLDMIHMFLTGRLDITGEQVRIVSTPLKTYSNTPMDASVFSEA